MPVSELAPLDADFRVPKRVHRRAPGLPQGSRGPLLLRTTCLRREDQVSNTPSPTSLEGGKAAGSRPPRRGGIRAARSPSLQPAELPRRAEELARAPPPPGLANGRPGRAQCGPASARET